MCVSFYNIENVQNRFLIPFYDGKNVSKLNSFKYKIVVNNNSKKIKLVKLKTNSLFENVFSNSVTDFFQ